MKHTLLIIAIIGLALINVGMADQRQESLMKYHKVNQQIKGVKSSLKQASQLRANYTKQLKTIEISMGRLNVKLQQTTANLTQVKTKLSALQQQQQSYLQQLTQQNQSLSAQVRSAYLLSREQYIKVLLNQQNPQRINLMLHYYHYFNQARWQLIKRLNSTLAKLKTSRQQIQTQTATLGNLLQQQQVEKQQLQSTEKQRKKVVVKLGRQINSKRQRLKQLMANKQALATVLAQLKNHKIVKQTVNLARLRFRQMRGKLPWPTKGRIVRDYGSSISSGAMKLNGVVLGAREGQAVHAIYAGKVVFANWLRGFGLLIIVDHGHGYMTLYGRNESLYRKVGDKVTAGQLLARVGKSGGYDESGLYFGIRYNGNPLNPAYWCQR